VEHLITKYLEGGLTLDEQHDLSKWLQSEERNAQTLKKIEDYWHNHKDNIHKEELEVRSRLHQMMETEVQSPLRKQQHFSWKRIYRVAAVIAVVLSTVFGVYKYSLTTIESNHVAEIEMIEKVTLPGQKITTKLPDGTIVSLNAGSRLVFPKEFQGGLREVELVGEAFFQVEKNPQKPFIVTSGNLTTTVLGTSFNIQAYPEDFEIQVTVATGRVQVKSDFENNMSEEFDIVYLSPNQQVTFNRADNLMTKSTTDIEKFIGWKDGIIRLEEIPLEEAVLILERWYGVEINLENEALGSCKIANGIYKDESLINVLKSFQFILDIDFKILTKDNIIISGPGC
jgi:transmembrane sensor